MKTFGVYTNPPGGPLKLEKVFSKLRFAENFAESIPDYWGRTRTWRRTDDLHEYGLVEVRPIEVIHFDLAAVNRAEQALFDSARAKLSVEELDAFGLS
jgi:hypothetical protein